MKSLLQLAGVDHVVFIQKNSLDLRARTLKIEARNESFQSRLSINEHCMYSVSVKPDKLAPMMLPAVRQRQGAGSVPIKPYRRNTDA